MNDLSPIICIHGFLGAPWNMRYIAKHFEKEGRRVINWEYHSRDKKIEEHAEDLVKEIRDLCAENPGHPLFFVAHSMGCLVLRAALNYIECPNEAKMGKAVLLAPPNHGSCWGRFLGKFTFAKKVAKDLAGKQLLTEKDFKNLGDFPPSLRVLVIAGHLDINPLISEANDGVVAVSETYLNTPHEHIILKIGHVSILFSKKAFNLSKKFLES